jgi:G3E family GTPase
VATVDALAGDGALDTRPEARRQAAFADQLIITKSDLAGAEVVAALAKRVKVLNPMAALTIGALGDVDPSVLLPALDPNIDRWAEMVGASDDNQGHHSHSHAHGEVTSITLRREMPIRAAALPLLLETLAEMYGPKLLRIKGLAAIAEAPERPAIIHGVQHVFHPMEWLDAWPDDDRTTRLTLIGEGLMAGWPDILLDFLDEESGLAMS